jgi:MerR family redox-sensitive transcriptional activator SoxR
MTESLTIGQLAEQFGLNTSAIRYYERVGVLPPPVREGGQRRYGAEAVKRMAVLETAKRAGFTLEESRLLLERTEAGSPTFEALRELADRKLPEVDSLIARAQAMRGWLLAAADCSCTTFDACALFDTGARGGSPG